jgi:hypothetical protein
MGRMVLGQGGGWVHLRSARVLGTVGSKDYDRAANEQAARIHLYFFLSTVAVLGRRYRRNGIPAGDDLAQYASPGITSP